MSSFQRLPNGPSSGLEDGELDRQREGEIERQRAELSQLRERLALMCRQVSLTCILNEKHLHITDIDLKKIIISIVKNQNKNIENIFAGFYTSTVYPESKKFHRSSSSLLWLVTLLHLL